MNDSQSPLSSGSVAVTILVAVRNEAANIVRCLDACQPASRVVVLDSQSTDRTGELAQERGAEVVQFEHQGGYPKKRQWALETLNFHTDWVLLLDADEVIPTDLWREIVDVVDSMTVCPAYLIRKGFHFLGRRIRFGGFSHQAVLLVRPEKVRFEKLIDVPGDTLDMEVHERVIVNGPIGVLKTPLIHEDFKGLEAYIDKHNRYSTWEAHVRYNLFNNGRYGEASIRPRLFGNAQERRRWLKKIAIKLPGEPWLWFTYHFLFRLGFIEGRPGLIACQIRQQYISNVRAKIYQLRISSGEMLN